MDKLNCWEALKCGLEPGGTKAKIFGTCIAATEDALDGVNSGKNAGRACWALLGTLCHEEGRPKQQDTYSQKLKRCTQCRFFELVAIQEGRNFKNTRMIVEEYDKKHETH
jgi:hypothetical protein